MRPQAAAPQPVPATDRAPIDDFSQCHAGIVSHLKEFDRLPALLAPATEARQIAGRTLGFFRKAVFEHHADEERELFPAVLASATAGDERHRVQLIVDRLTAEHRNIERHWALLEPQLKRVAKGHDSTLDGNAVASLVADYLAHAAYEEREFLPLSAQILGRNANHMAALGLSLHIRHADRDAWAATAQYI